MTTPAAPAVDNPNWHRHQAAGHWTPPPPCPHPASLVFGPCACADQDRP